MPAPQAVPSDLIQAALPDRHVWPGRPRPDDLVTLPAAPAVYVLVDGRDAFIQLATTQSLRRLLLARLTDPQRQGPGKTDIAEIARGVRWRALANAFEGRWWYYRLARALFPGEYRAMISFGPAYYLHVDWQQRVPELRVTERIWTLPGEFIGPWPSHRSCQEALVGLWDLFDLCRYPEQVRRAPHGTRCAYAEMGRCDAPCDGAVPIATYAERCRAAWCFAAGGVNAWLAEAAQRMQTAAAAQTYELAGQIKQQIRFAEHWRAHWLPVVRLAALHNDLLVLPVTRRRAARLLLARQGCIDEGPIVPLRRLADEGGRWSRVTLAAPPPATVEEERMEQSWLLAHLRFNREWDAVLGVPLDTGAAPADLDERLAQYARTRGGAVDAPEES